jgi:signal transduction histidine kinase
VRRVPPWGVDVALAAAVAFAGTLPSNHHTQWAYPAAVAAGIALVARRRWPVLVLLATFPALYGGLGTIATGAALYALGKMRPRLRVVLPWLGIAMAVTMAPVVERAVDGYPFGPQEWGDWVATVLVVLVVTAGPAAAGALTATRAELVASLSALRATEADRDAAVTARARAEERNRIAREVHDIVGHYASLIAVQASALEAHAPDAETKATAIRLRELSSDALEEMRTAVALWRRTDDGDVIEDWVPWVLQPAIVARESGVPMHVTRVDGLGPAVDQAVLRVLRRAVQEGVTNAVRHCPGSDVRVELAPADGQVRVSVSNPLPPAGPDARPDTDRGTGLAGLRERVRLLGGTLTAGRTDDRHWLLAVHIPVDNP